MLAGALLGFGFLTKMLQAFLVLPAFALVYLVAGAARLGRRIVQLLAGGAALLVAAGWWVAIVQFTPAADRPYVGGSHQQQHPASWPWATTGSAGWTATRPAAVGGGGGGGRRRVRRVHRRSAGCSPREMGGQISWLLPAALIALAALVWLILAAAADRPGPGRGAAVGRLAGRHRRWCSAT